MKSVRFAAVLVCALVPALSQASPSRRGRGTSIELSPEQIYEQRQAAKTAAENQARADARTAGMLAAIQEKAGGASVVRTQSGYTPGAMEGFGCPTLTATMSNGVVCKAYDCFAGNYGRRIDASCL